MHDKRAEQNARSSDELQNRQRRWRRFDRIEDLDRGVQETGVEDDEKLPSLPRESSSTNES